MTPEAERHLQRARLDLAVAHSNLQQEWWHVAAREAYLAAFHAAQAVVFEIDGRRPKTHAGLQSRFSAISREEEGLGVKLPAFLSSSYLQKQTADYETLPDLTEAEAGSVLTGAAAFVDVVEAWLQRR